MYAPISSHCLTGVPPEFISDRSSSKTVSKVRPKDRKAFRHLKSRVAAKQLSYSNRITLPNRMPTWPSLSWLAGASPHYNVQVGRFRCVLDGATFPLPGRGLDGNRRLHIHATPAFADTVLRSREVNRWSEGFGSPTCQSRDRLAGNCNFLRF